MGSLSSLLFLSISDLFSLPFSFLSLFFLFLLLPLSYFVLLNSFLFFACHCFSARGSDRQKRYQCLSFNCVAVTSPSRHTANHGFTTHTLSTHNHPKLLALPLTSPVVTLYLSLYMLQRLIKIMHVCPLTVAKNAAKRTLYPQARAGRWHATRR